MRAIRLFKKGVLTKGKLISKVSTESRFNERIVYELTFRFKDKLGNEYDVSEKTRFPALLEDDKEESLLYLPDNPDYAIMLDTLPSSPSINREGNIESSPSLLTLIIPLITISGHGLYILIKFF